MPRISQLPSLTTADNADEIAIVDVSASTTKKITRGDLLKSPLPTDSVTTAAIQDGAVTPVKRSGGFYTAQITFTSGTGPKAITGFGFKPKMVNVQAARTDNAVVTFSEGSAVDNGGTISQTFYAMTITATARRTIDGDTATAAIADPASGNLYVASVTSFDNDGVTFNVTTDSGSAAYRKWNLTAWA